MRERINSVNNEVRERVNSIDTQYCGEVAKATRRGCGCGLAIFIGAGLLAGLLGGVLGASCSLRIPATESNVSAFIASGHKYQIEPQEPDFIRNRDRGAAVLDEQLDTFLFGSLRFKQIFTIGKQPNSPNLWTHIEVPAYKDGGGLGTRQMGIMIPDTTSTEDK